MKRFVFLMLNVFFLGLAILPSFLLWGSAEDFILNCLLVLLIGLVSAAGYVLLLLMANHFISNYLDVHWKDVIDPFQSLLTIGMKKSYDVDYGEFYLEMRDVNELGSDVMVYKQEWFCMYQICSMSYNGDIDGFKRDLKNRLDTIYKRENKINNVIKNWKDWSGAIDLRTERDNKLKKLIG